MVTLTWVSERLCNVSTRTCTSCGPTFAAGELCKALRSLPGVQLSNHEVRLLLAYLFHYGDKDKDLRLSVAELQSSLAPFVPRPKEEELQRAVAAYNANHNLPALLRNIHKLQPALLSAVCTQLSGGAGAASPFPLESLGALIAMAAPGKPCSRLFVCTHRWKAHEITVGPFLCRCDHSFP